MAAQQTPYVVGATVTGHVICADTNGPARFAKVFLKSSVPDHTGEDFLKNLQKNIAKSAKDDATPQKPVSDDQKRAMAEAARSMNRVTDMMNASTVGLDGAYSFAGVKPGTYYVHATVAGYIDPFSEFSDDDFASTDPVIKARIAQIPTVTITGSNAAHVDLRLDRGAAVSGRILFDDGSPAAGWTLTVVKPKSPESPEEAASAIMNQALAMGGAVQIYKTDDLGHYRISGLEAGEYVVKAALVATGVGISATNLGDGGSGINLAVYSGDTFTRAGATPVTLTAGEEHPGVDITVPARSLHNIVGHVYAKADGHTLNMGSISLTSKEKLGLPLKAAIRDDGSFHFEYLPGNTTYTVTVDDAADGRTDGVAGKFMGISLPKQEVLHKYGTDTTEVKLDDADVDSVKLTVAQTDWTPPAKKAGAKDADPGALLNSLFSSGDDDSKQ
jgi:hypothetical protein